MMESTLGFLFIGFALGLRHALEADHVIAVSTIVSQEQRLWRSTAVGLVWGIGHTATLLAVGAVVLGLRLTIPPGLGISFELAVGVILVLLGAGVVLGYRRKRVHVHPHRHSGDPHVHFHSHRNSPAHGHVHAVRRHGRSFLVGMVHGLEGSGALMILVTSQITSLAGGLLYLLTFGFGSILGMVLLSTLIGLSFLSLGRMGRLADPLRLATGLASLVLGVWIIGTTAVTHGLIPRL